MVDIAAGDKDKRSPAPSTHRASLRIVSVRAPVTRHSDPALASQTLSNATSVLARTMS